MRSFRVSSVVRAAPEAVWERATTIAGVNAELWPLARMTGEGEIREGALGRSWILALGVLPIDDDDICLEAVEPGRGFRERSRLGSCSAWHHDRTLTALADGTRIVDEVAFTPAARRRRRAARLRVRGRLPLAPPPAAEDLAMSGLELDRLDGGAVEVVRLDGARFGGARGARAAPPRLPRADLDPRRARAALDRRRDGAGATRHGDGDRPRPGARVRGGRGPATARSCASSEEMLAEPGARRGTPGWLLAGRGGRTVLVPPGERPRSTG